MNIRKLEPDISDAVMDPKGTCPTCYQRLHVNAADPQAERAEDVEALVDRMELDAEALESIMVIPANQCSFSKTLRDAAALLRRLAAEPCVTEATPNDGGTLDHAIKHHLPVYEVDFGEEGKGRYIRLGDFNRVLDSLAAEQGKDRKDAPKLIGWRTDDYLMETSDLAVARNWQGHHRVLPIFEGDSNTKLDAAMAHEGVT